MEQLYIADRATIDCADELIASFGSAAATEAAARADASRDRGNVVTFCRWRQVERVIQLLGCDVAIGTIQ